MDDKQKDAFALNQPRIIVTLQIGGVSCCKSQSYRIQIHVVHSVKWDIRWR